jgi:hypothetical protein
MARDFGWRASARLYLKLFDALVARRERQQREPR